MSNVVIDIAAQFTGNKAFKQAETASQKLDKSVARLGKQLAGVFAVSKVKAYAVASVKAFAADDKAARALAQTLANTGNAFAALGVEQFIADTQRATGVLDDELRPAFQQLITVTGSVAKSQEALNLALDISAGTGKSLSAVTAALSKGYAGNTTALSRLGAGLSKATLKSNDMNKITEELSKKFSGQAAVAAEGYSGQLARLTVASQNAKEIIGKDLLDAMNRIAGNEGIGGATTAIEDFATQTGNAITAVSRLLALINKFPNVKAGLGQALNPFGFTGLGLLSKIGASSQKVAGQSPGQRAAIDKENIRLAKEKNSLSKIDNTNTKEKLQMTAGEKALAELKRLFDIEGIQIQAALNNTTDQEIRARLLSLQALKNEDEILALLALNQMKAADAAQSFTEKLNAFVLNPELYAALRGTGAYSAATGSAAPYGGYSTGYGEVPSSISPYIMNPELYAGVGAKVNISINPAVAGLIDVIQNSSASGVSPTVNRNASSYIA